MALHRLCCLEIAVPDVDATAAFYRDFGLSEVAAGKFATAAGGVQLALVAGPVRRPRELAVGVDDQADLKRIAGGLSAIDAHCELHDGYLLTHEPALGIAVRVSIAPRIAPRESTPQQRGPRGARAPEEGGPIRPRKLGHIVFGSPDPIATCRLLVDGLGFKISDHLKEVNASFLRCSTDHHNVLVQPGPRSFLHHTAWELADIDEIGRGAMRMLDRDAKRHVWGLGRHVVGSNFFWYLRDPAGNFAEYYSDVDHIGEAESWAPGEYRGRAQLYAWGPPPPIEFLLPPDVYGQR